MAPRCYDALTTILTHHIRRRLISFFGKWMWNPLSHQKALFLQHRHNLPFFHETSRSLPESLNVYFVLLNAEIKFNRFLKNFGIDKLHPDMKAPIEQTIQIVNLMYTRPVRS